MKKILVALDGSPRESGVLDAAIALARKSGAHLLLFRSVGIPVELPADAYSMALDEVPKLLERQATAALKVLEGKVPENLRGGVRVMIGTPWRSIEEAAGKENVDLIVVGAHGHQGLDKLLGTTAAKVVNHADRAVLVVRAHERLTRE
ncbi:MAG TPA: universal stress protein [Polyangiaceae bacterium]